MLSTSERSPEYGSEFKGLGPSGSGKTLSARMNTRQSGNPV